MSYDHFKTLNVSIAANRVATITLDNPPINLITVPMMIELYKLADLLAADDAVQVIIFESANPDFFLAHFDLNAILSWPTETDDQPPQPSAFAAMVLKYRHMPKVSIAKLKGIARGGGSEFLLGLDMCFADAERAVLNQIEVPLGIVPGGGGTQYLARYAGRNRALEAVLGAKDFSAVEAEKYGWINRALPSDRLDSFVDDLARRIAASPAEMIAAAKRAIDFGDADLAQGLATENSENAKLMASGMPAPRMQQALALGAQTPEGEIDIERLLEKL